MIRSCDGGWNSHVIILIFCIGLARRISLPTLSRGNCNAMNSGSLAELHQALCHPGVTRMFHFVKSRNLPYSMEDVKRMNRSCHICAECKPQFHKPDSAHLIKATQPFER